MRKLVLTVASLLLVVGVVLCGCSETDNDRTLGHMDGPKITIEKITINGVEYAPKDTIEIAGASEVIIDYIVECESDIMLINDYYVSGSTGALLEGRSRSDLAASGSLRRYSGRLFCDTFLPFRCGFRIFAADSYGGTDSKGFYLRLPASGLSGVPGNTPLFTHSGRNFGPGQGDANCSFGKVVQNGFCNGRYTQADLAGANTSSSAGAAERARSHDFGSAYMDGRLVMFSPHRFNHVIPENTPVVQTPTSNFLPFVIRYYTNTEPNTTFADISVTKFKRLDLFTSSMWNSLTTNEQLQYLADSFMATTTEEVVYPEGVGYYFYYTTGQDEAHKLTAAPCNQAKWVPGFDGTFFGIIYVRNTGTPTSYAQYDLKIYKFWI